MNGDDFEFEIWLTWRGPREYGVTVRFTRPDANEDFRPPAPATIVCDLAQFRALAQDDRAYGAALTGFLFGDPGVAATFATARAVAQQEKKALRVRLFIGIDARELQSLRWELLRDPASGEPMLTQSDLLFSRYLSSLDWMPIPARSRGGSQGEEKLTALVVVANPSDLDKYAPGGIPLAAIKVEEEIARAKEFLGLTNVEVLANPERATIDRIGERLRKGFDVLYLVCHGTLGEDAPRLWLEDEQGMVARVAATDLVARVHDAVQRPRLVLLASCESGNTGAIADDGGLVAIGPRLAQAGVPAVVAMNGKVSMKTLAAFLPVFFKELAADGRVDRAMAIARCQVRDAHDWWMPVLFMRLRNGRLWYEHGFGPGPGGLDQWDALLDEVNDGSCVPILGPGLTETLVGSLRDVARGLAERFDFPLAPHSRDDLAQVAQFLAYRQTRAFARKQFREHLKQRILEQFRDRLPADLLKRPFADVTLDELLSAAGRSVRTSRSGDDVHARLAQLPFTLYVTANRDNLLRDALTEAGKQPQVQLVRWKDSREWPDLAPPEGKPDLSRPVILHLFGNLEYPDTLVLSEDDYLDFLLGVARGQQRGRSGGREVIPQSIASRLAESGLLFLGFQLDDWEFRVLFRAVLMQEGSALGEDHPRVAVQLSPAEGRILEPVGARKYLERYFKKRGNYGVYWGSVEEFIADLTRRRGVT